MALLIVAPNRDTNAVERRLKNLAPRLTVRIWPDIGAPEEIEFAVLWKQPPGLFARLPALQAVTSYGAGVETILADPDLPPTLPVGRICGPRLAADMAEYLAAAVIAQHRGLWGFYEDRKAGRWAPWAPEALPIIGLLGLGQMGRAAAKVFRALGYPLHGWSRSGRGPRGVAMHRGEKGLATIAKTVDFLLCLLPLTPKTAGILNAALFARMKRGAYLINVGRGGHLIETDLIAALDAEHLSGACLDVFSEEPLPSDHPFWTHPKIYLTPHCASYTQPEEAARLILKSYRRVRRGLPPLDAVDRKKGY